MCNWTIHKHTFKYRFSCKNNYSKLIFDIALLHLDACSSLKIVCDNKIRSWNCTSLIWIQRYLLYVLPVLTQLSVLMCWQACKQHMDAVVFMFAFNDKSSFNDLPNHMTRLLDSNEDICRFVIGSKYPFANCEPAKVLISLLIDRKLSCYFITARNTWQSHLVRNNIDITLLDHIDK